MNTASFNSFVRNSFVRNTFVRDYFVRNAFASAQCGSILWVAVFCLALVGVSPNAASAEEQLTEITWGHSTPERVSRFIVMVSPTGVTTPETRWIEVGKPAGSSSDSMEFYTALIPVSSDEYISIGAIGTNGLMSSLTPWSPVPPSRPGQPLVIEP